MRLLSIWLLSLSACLGEKFDIHTVIHPAVAKLVVPEVSPAMAAMPLAISTKSENASEYVRAGFYYLNAPWDFEAYRHFAAALKEDPDCLMAYWGIAMSLGGLNHEYYEQRKAAVDRMLDLLEAGMGVEWEKGFCQAAGNLYTNGAKAAAEVYGKISEKYPNNIQARLFSLFLGRDGYNDIGKPGVGQEKCIEGLKELLEHHPENSSVISTWVLTRAEAPLNPAMLRDEVLPFARKLARLHPDFPPFQLIAGHVEARCGNAALASEYCAFAVTLFTDYMQKNGVTIYDCPGLLRAKVYQSSLLAARGKVGEAMVIADELAKIDLEAERVFSRGAAMLLWEGRSLAARLALSDGRLSQLNRALKLLESFKDEKWFKEKSLAVSYRNALAYCIGVRKALLKKDAEAANRLYADLITRVQVIDREMLLAKKTSSYTEYLRARNAVELFAVELRGMLAMNKEGAMKRSALTWFKSATDRQSRSANLLPPAVPYPMENRIGEYYLSEGDAGAAAKAYRAGMVRMPNHLGSLRGYREALMKLGKNEAAKQVAQRIEMVQK